MIAALGRWRIEINPSQPLGYDVIRTREIAPVPSSEDPDLLETVGDFIARQVLEKDSSLFDG